MDKDQQQRYRKERKAQGYARLELIVHKDDREAVKTLARRLELRRLRAKQ